MTTSESRGPQLTTRGPLLTTRVPGILNRQPGGPGSLTENQELITDDQGPQGP